MVGFGRLGLNIIKKFSETQTKKMLQNSFTFTSRYRETRNEQKLRLQPPLVRNSYVGRRQTDGSTLDQPRKILLYFFLPWTSTPYSKMAAIQKFPFIFMLISPLCLDCTYRLEKKNLRPRSMTVLSIYYFFVYKSKPA